MVKESTEKKVPDCVSSLSTEQISEHPFVQMMLQRLQALEDKHGNATLTAGPIEEVPTKSDEEKGTEPEHKSQKCQVLVCSV